MSWIKWVEVGLTIATAIKTNGWAKTRDSLVNAIESVFGVSTTGNNSGQ